jgi:Ca-activated chloride channel family protein
LIRKKLQKLADVQLLSVLVPDYSKGRYLIKFILFCGAISSLIIALAQPQFGIKLQEVKKKGIEVVVALDVSNSMLAQDVKPSRIEKAKLSIQKIMEDLDQDKVSIVIFAGEAYTQLPMTTDISASKMFLQAIHTNYIAKQGTAIGAAISKGIRSFSDDPKVAKTIIVISDGENHEDDAIEEAKRAKEMGIIVHAVGMGSPEGAPIPRENQAGQLSFMEDNSGRPITTKLNEEMLQNIAKEGGGVYSRVDFAPIIRALDSVTKTDFETKQYSEYDEKFQYFLWLALIFLGIEFLVLERKNKWLKHIQIFKIK